jgi:hypothetical protein
MELVNGGEAGAFGHRSVESHALPGKAGLETGRRPGGLPHNGADADFHSLGRAAAAHGHSLTVAALFRGDYWTVRGRAQSKSCFISRR